MPRVLLTGGYLSQRLLVALALLALYFIWGATYLAMFFAIESFPPFMMAAIRFSLAGGLLYVFLRWRGYPAPRPKEWLGALVVGVLLLSIGNVAVAVAQKTVSTSAAAMAIATVPLWIALFSGLWGVSHSRREWLGIMLGILGAIVLASGGALRASPEGALLILLAAVSWAFGSVWGKHLPMPDGVMGSAAQMVMGGAVLIVLSVLQGEPWPASISEKSLWAMVFLIFFGSIIAYSAYQYLLKTVRPALATSNTFVNPVVAMFLGVWLANEVVDAQEMVALVIIIIGVLLVMPFRAKPEV
ncbi:MAG: drug/metabolite exporter YedA [Betaproteobacteria bacterium HGW-Betaproteobacteria-8]|nr:MAG: drug/metabolite exporter YedA [Betaproteobacteria bacterium HGW-Betaproteobacteria-8]